MRNLYDTETPPVLVEARLVVDELLTVTSAAALVARDLNEKFLLSAHAAHIADALHTLIGDDAQPTQPLSLKLAERFDLRSSLGDAVRALQEMASGLDPAREGRTLWVMDEAIRKIQHPPAPVTLSAAPTPVPSPIADLTPLHSASRASTLQPWRPASWRHGQDPALAGIDSWDALVADERAIGAMVHFLIADIEINVLDICCALIVDSVSEGLPAQFRIDLALQAWDEARHAVFLEAELRALGFALGEFAVDDKPWRVHRGLSTCLDQLIAQQVASEGNGIDAAGAFVNALVVAGRTGTAEAIVLQNRDEIDHCRNAVQWVLEISGNDRSQAVREVERVVGAIGVSIPGPHPVDHDARAAAGFTQLFPTLAPEPARPPRSAEVGR